jgi:hypothetical protein
MEPSKLERRIDTSLKERDMKLPAEFHDRLRSQSSAASRNPETVALIAAILQQMDHATNLVVAFFRSLGLTGDNGKRNDCFPPEFLLELGALLQFREWQDAGVVQWSHPDGLTVDDLILQSIDQLQQGPRAFAHTRRGSEAMVSLLRTWNETCSPVAREHLACDIAIEWDSDGDIEQLVESLAEFAWRHRDRADGKELVR